MNDQQKPQNDSDQKINDQASLQSADQTKKPPSGNVFPEPRTSKSKRLH
jgi:hypothetical protein